MICPHCTSATTKEQTQKTALGYRMFRCSVCKHLFNERTGTPFNFLEYPTDVELISSIGTLAVRKHRSPA